MQERRSEGAHPLSERGARAPLDEAGQDADGSFAQYLSDLRAELKREASPALPLQVVEQMTQVYIEALVHGREIEKKLSALIGELGLIKRERCPVCSRSGLVEADCPACSGKGVLPVDTAAERARRENLAAAVHAWRTANQQMADALKMLGVVPKREPKRPSKLKEVLERLKKEASAAQEPEVLG